MEKNDYVLSDTEYKNIQARLIKSIFYYLFVFILMYLVGNYFALKHFVSSIVSSYITKEKVISEMNDKISETKAAMQKQYSNFVDTFDIVKSNFFKNVENTDKLPYSINNNVVTLFDDTSKIIIEYGSGFTLDTIHFKAKFKYTPVVMINANDDDAMLYHPFLRQIHYTDKRAIYHQVYTSLNSFYALSRENIRTPVLVNKKYPITWIAFGE